MKKFTLTLISLFLFFFGLSQPALKPVDTLYIPHSISRVQSYYSAVEKSQVNAYFYIDSLGRAIFQYCVNSLYPTSSFVMNSAFSNYFAMNRNKFAVGYGRNNFLLCMDSLSVVTDTLKMDLGMENDEPFTLWTTQWSYYIPVNQDSGLLYSSRALISLSDYKVNKEHRVSKFSHPMITEFSLNKNHFTALRGIGQYPTAHFNMDSTYRHYWFFTAMNKDLDIITSYFFLDSLFVIHRNNTQDRYFFKSRYQQHVNQTIDFRKNNDYNYLNQIANESTSYLYLHYDSYREMYYVVVSKATAFENEDGTFNNAGDNPWSLIILDSKFNQMAEIDMPEHLSKHELMIIPEGLAVKDLTQSDKNKSCFIIYKIFL